MTTHSKTSEGFRLTYKPLALKQPDVAKFANPVAVAGLLGIWPELVNGPKLAPVPADRVPVNGLDRTFLAQGLLHGFRAGDKP